MNVVLTCNYSPWSRYSGGGQRSTHALALALTGLGHRVVVVYTKPPWEKVDVPGALPYEIRWASFVGVRSTVDAPLRPLNALPVAAVVWRVVRELGTAVVHGQGEEAALVPEVRARTGCRFFMTPRYPRLPEALGRADAGVLRRAWIAATAGKYVLLGRALRGAERVCPTSRSAADMVQRAYGLDPARIVLVPNGIDARFLAVPRRDDAAAGPAVFFGRLSRTKGVDTLLEALARLGDAAPRCRIIGRGPDEAAFRRQAAELGLGGRVELVAWLPPDDLARELAAASMVVLPSREESFGNAMAEAMAAAAPLVTTTVGSVPEVVTHQRTGLLVPPDDPDALAAAMRSLRADPAAATAMGLCARADVRARFSWEATARAFVALYEG